MLGDTLKSILPSIFNFPIFPLTKKIAYPPPLHPKRCYSIIDNSEFGDRGVMSFPQRHGPTVAELRVGAALTVKFCLQTDAQRPAVHAATMMSFRRTGPRQIQPP